MAQKPSEHSGIEGQLSFLDESVPPEPAAPPGHPGPASMHGVPASAEPLPSSARAGVHDVDANTDQDADAGAADDGAPALVGPNTRIRAGNAMQRARAGAVRGALDTLMRRGLRKLTMSEAADRGGLARATLYNHVRDKDELLALLLEHESQTVAEAFVAAPTMETALTSAAAMIAEHPALVALREREPEALVRLTVPDAGAVRDLAVSALTSRGSEASPTHVDLVLRWLASFVASPSDPQVRAEQAAALAKMLA